MAIQQAGTGYRDPVKTQTIKALQDRQKLAMAAAMKATEVSQPIANPWQGAAHLTHILGTGLEEGRAASQEADARAQLAGIMQGIDPTKGASMEQIAHMQQLDPEFANKEYERGMAAREAEKRQQEQQQFTTSERLGTQEFTGGQQTQQFAHQDTTAETLAKTQEAAAVAAGQRTAAEKLAEDQRLVEEKKREEALPQTDVGKITQDYNNGAYGTVGSPEAIAARDAEMHKATFTQPTKIADLMSPGGIKTDQDAAPVINEWKQTGGPNAAKAVTQVNKALDILQTKGPTGLVAGIMDKTLPDYASKWLNPDANIARASMRETVQQTLRQTLGAQFTEKEGTDLMDRAFDISLQPAENIRRAKLILDQVTQIAANKQEMANYWDTHNQSLQGYSPKPIDVQTLRDMFKDPSTDQGTGAPADTGGWTVRKKGP